MKSKEEFKITNQFLPASLVEDLDKLTFPDLRARHEAMHFLVLLYNKQLNNDTSWNVPLSKTYLTCLFRQRYSKDFLDLLIENDLVHCDEKAFYTTKENLKKGEAKSSGKPYFYNIKFKYFKDKKLVGIVYNVYKSGDKDETHQTESVTKISDITSVSKRDIQRKFRISDNAIDYRKWEETWSGLTFDKEALESIMDIHIESIRIEQFNMNDNISNLTNFKLRCPMDKVFMPKYRYVNERSKEEVYTKNFVIRLSLQMGLDVIQDKHKAYISTPDFFIERKKTKVNDNYTSIINRLLLNDFKISRDPHNRNIRLNSIFTQVPKILMKQIIKDNELIEIDCKNSQWAVFANWIKNTVEYQHEDVSVFCRHAFDGSLYEMLQRELNIASREKTKILMMNIGFAPRKGNIEYRSIFKEKFPNVYRFISAYKKEFGDSNFATQLQDREAILYIDNIAKILLNKKIFLITKHDSLIVRRADKAKVINIIKKYMGYINFDATLTVSDDEDYNTTTDLRISEISDDYVFSEDEGYILEKKAGSNDGRVSDSQNHDEIIQMTDNTPEENGADSGEINTIQKGSSISSAVSTIY